MSLYKILLNFLLIVLFFLISFSFAKNGLSINWENKPQDLIENIKDNTQSTNLSKNINTEKGIKPVIEKVSNNLNYYLNWIIFFALSIATILLMLNGIQMMINAGTGKEGDISKFKTRFINIFIGIVVVLGFTLILKIVIAVLNTIF